MRKMLLRSALVGVTMWTPIALAQSTFTRDHIAAGKDLTIAGWPAVSKALAGAPGGYLALDNTGAVPTSTVVGSTTFAGMQLSEANAAAAIVALQKVGVAGVSPTVAVGTTATVAATVAASVTDSGTGSAHVLNFSIPQGPQGLQGTIGQTGAAGTGLYDKGAWVTGTSYPAGSYVFAAATGNPGYNSMWIYQGSTTYASTTQPNADLMHWSEFQAPPGPSAYEVAVLNGYTGNQTQWLASLQGAPGSNGQPGTAGVSPTISAGTVSALAPTASPTVTDVGTGSTHQFNFGIPSGAPGAQGTPGVSPTLAAGTATALVAGSAPTVTDNGNGTAHVFNFGVPAGAAGATPTVAAGTATPLASTASPTVTDSGSGINHILNFGIPAGTPGATGISPTIKVGATTTGQAGTSAAVTDTVSGTTHTLNFTVPQGVAGSASSQTVAYGTTAGTAAQGNDSRIVGALQTANYLSELTSSSTQVQVNLGLGAANAANGWSKLDSTAHVPASTLPLATATVPGVVQVGLGVVNGAAALDAAGNLNATALAAFGIQARLVSMRFSDEINVRDYKKPADPDDTLAFKRAFAISTGAITGNSLFTSAEQTRLVALHGVGPNVGGNVKIKVPAGTYFLSDTLTANMLVNSGFAMEGDLNATAMVWSNAGDGIDINFAANNPNASTGYTGGNDQAQAGAGTSYAGQAIMIGNLKLQTAYQDPVDSGGNITTYNSGIALNVTGIQLAGSDLPPSQYIHDVTVTNRDGWVANTEAWGVGVRFTDPDNLYMERVKAYDRRQGHMVGFQMVSNALQSPVPQNTDPYKYNGHGGIYCNECSAEGGLDFFDISGIGFQGITLSHATWQVVGTGVQWLEPLTGNNSGSIQVTDASGSAGVANVHMQNIGTFYDHGSFYYTAFLNPGHDRYTLWLDGVDWAHVTDDMIAMQGAGAQGSSTTNGVTTTYHQYGILINQGLLGVGGYDPQPSLIDNTSVSGGDYQFSGQGSHLFFDNIISDRPNIAAIVDTYTGTSQALHPSWTNVHQLDNSTIADAGPETVLFEAFQHTMNGGLVLGMPGVTGIPGVSGNAGALYFRSLAAATAGQFKTGYDCGIIPSGGSLTVTGAGSMKFACTGGDTFDGPITAPSITIAGAATALVTNTTGLEVGTGTATGTIDLHTNGEGTIDYSGRFYASGNAGGVTGGGTVNLLATGGLQTNGPIVDGAYTVLSAASGVAYAAPDNQSGVAFNHTGTLATLPITLPANPVPGKVYSIKAIYGWVASLQLSTTASTAGVTPTVSPYVPTSLSPGVPVAVQYDATDKIWVPYFAAGSGPIAPVAYSGSHTFSAADCNGPKLQSTSATQVSWYVPAGLPLGCRITAEQYGAGELDAQPASGSGLASHSAPAGATHPSAQYGDIEIYVDGPNSFQMKGN